MSAKKIQWIPAALVLAFVLLQFTNPPRINPPGKNSFPITNAPLQIGALLRAACYDCHSDETQWPWYSRIAPISWTIASDVNYGRGQLNFSDWPKDDPLHAAKALEDMSEEIGYGEMPPKKYALIHAGARLTEKQRQELTDWLDSEAARLKILAKNNHVAQRTDSSRR